MSNGKRYAVVIGVSRYDDDQIANLPYAKNDALRVAQALVAAGEFKKDQVYLLANDVPTPHPDLQCSDPTRGEIFKKLHYVADNAGPGDLILVFFAGHGVEVSKSPYLLSCDTMMDVLKETGVNVVEMNDVLEKSKATTVLRIFDSCRSPFGDTRTAMGGMTRGFEDALMHVGSGWASLSSCSSGEVAHESGELNHGIFSYYLCEGLEGKAANEDGDVTWDRLVDYVRICVDNWCDQQSQKQTPHLETKLSGRVDLARMKRATPSATPSIDNPFDALVLAIDRHLAETPRDARSLTFTDPKELESVSRITEATIKNLAESFQHRAVLLIVTERKPLRQLSSRSWNQLIQDTNVHNLHPEFTGDTSAEVLRFVSAEVIIPQTELTIAVVRFSFFYWLWYRHVCVVDQLQSGFSPSPRETKGFFTFKPKAAVDGLKVDATLREIFKRCSSDIVSWSGQLKEYVNSRMDPLRKIGDIIE